MADQLGTHFPVVLLPGLVERFRYLAHSLAQRLVVQCDWQKDSSSLCQAYAAQSLDLPDCYRMLEVLVAFAVLSRRRFAGLVASDVIALFHDHLAAHASPSSYQCFSETADYVEIFRWETGRL